MQINSAYIGYKQQKRDKPAFVEKNMVFKLIVTATFCR